MDSRLVSSGGPPFGFLAGLPRNWDWLLETSVDAEILQEVIRKPRIPCLTERNLLCPGFVHERELHHRVGYALRRYQRSARSSGGLVQR